MSMEKEDYYTELDWLCEDHGFDIQYDFGDETWKIIITDKWGEVFLSIETEAFSKNMPSDRDIYNQLIAVLREEKLNQILGTN
jgi:hypothetical protein